MNLESIIEFGGIQSPVDERDFKPEDLGSAAPTPANFLQDISMVPVYDQNQQPACGGHGGTTLFQVLAKNGEKLSPRFVYALCKKIDGFPNQQGTTGRAIMQVLQKYGVCSDALFPNDTSLPFSQYVDWTKIPAAAYADALNRRIGAYAQLPAKDFQTIKDNISSKQAVLILGRIGKEWWTPSYLAKDILPLKPPATPVSGHFWVDYAFSPTYTNLRNSFGSDWGANGNGYYGDNYTPYIIEAWVANLPISPESVQQVVDTAQQITNEIEASNDPIPVKLSLLSLIQKVVQSIKNLFN